MTPKTQTEPRRNEVEQYAYFLYEQRGCQPGHELDDWLEAEKQLTNGVQDSESAVAERSDSRVSNETKRPTRKGQRMDVD